MPLNIKPSNLKYLILGAGGLGLALRTLLYAVGMDDRGLLVRGHWAETVLWAVTAAAVLGIILLTRSLSGSKNYGRAFPKSTAAAAGCAAVAVGILLNITPGSGGTSLENLELILAGTAIVSALVMAFCRFTGRKVPALFHCLVCIYLAVRMVGQYRLWSSTPQLQDYCFYLGSHVALMLTAYQFAAFDADMGSHRALWAWGLTSVYLCCLSLVGEGQPLLMLCCGIWVWTNLSRIRSRRQEEMSVQPEEPAEGADHASA